MKYLIIFLLALNISWAQEKPLSSLSVDYVQDNKNYNWWSLYAQFPLGEDLKLALGHSRTNDQDNQKSQESLIKLSKTFEQKVEASGTIISTQEPYELNSLGAEVGLTYFAWDLIKRDYLSEFSLALGFTGYSQDSTTTVQGPGSRTKTDRFTQSFWKLSYFQDITTWLILGASYKSYGYSEFNLTSTSRLSNTSSSLTDGYPTKTTSLYSTFLLGPKVNLDLTYSKSSYQDSVDSTTKEVNLGYRFNQSWKAKIIYSHVEQSSISDYYGAGLTFSW